MFRLPFDAYALSAAVALLAAFPVALAIDRSVPRWLVRAAWLSAPLAAASLLLERGPVAEDRADDRHSGRHSRRAYTRSRCSDQPTRREKRRDRGQKVGWSRSSAPGPVHAPA